MLSSYDLSGVRKQSPFDSAVNELNSTVIDSLNQAMLYTDTRKYKFSF
jgi:hypothetical protein